MFSWTNHSARISVTEDDIFQQRLTSQIYNLKINFYSSIIPRNINVYNTKYQLLSYVQNRNIVPC